MARSPGLPHPASVALTLGLALTLGPAAAHAQDGAPRPAWYTKRAERRSGVALGITPGFEVSGARAYPFTADAIGQPGLEQQAGTSAGAGGSFALMGALADYLNLGFWGYTGSGQSAAYRSSGAAFGFRAEVFPLYTLVPTLRDLGLIAQFGFGTARVERKDGTAPDGVVMQSYVGTGVFYEWRVASFLGGHLALGPSLEAGVAFAQSGQRLAFLLGPRVTFYGGP